MNLFAHAIYILSAAAIASTVPASAFSGGAGVFLTLGIIGLWRYGWALINFVRAHFYVRIAYPRRRAAAEALYNQRRPAHAFFLATSYKIDAGITARVYRSIFAAARQSRGGREGGAGGLIAPLPPPHQYLFDSFYRLPDGR